MTEEIKKFDTWLSTAQTGDKYTYYIGNLARESCLIDGYKLKQLRDHVMNTCCDWNLDSAPKKATDNKIQFKSEIRLVQKARKKYWDKKTKDVLNGSEYMAVKI
jgi:hypothetical protein